MPWGIRRGFPRSLQLIVSVKGRNAGLISNDGLCVKLAFLWKKFSFMVSNENNTSLVKLNILMINVKLRQITGEQCSKYTLKSIKFTSHPINYWGSFPPGCVLLCSHPPEPLHAHIPTLPEGFHSPQYPLSEWILVY